MTRLLPPKDQFAIGLSDGLPLQNPGDETLEQLRYLHPQTFEFETSWPQLFPRGPVTLHQATLDHYDRFADELLERGIEPRIILGEGSLPESAEDRGGYANRDIVYLFADYARALAQKLGDRISHWTTMRDPEAYRADKIREGWMSVHHRLLAHAYAREALQSEHPALSVGFGIKFWPIYPNSDRTRDHEAALRLEAILHRSYLDLLFHGRYNEAAVHFAEFECGGDVEFLRESDKHKLHNTADFLRLDYEFLPALSVEDAESYTRSARLKHKTNPKAEPYTHRRSAERLGESLRKLKAEYQPKAIELALSAPENPSEQTIHTRTVDTERMLYHTHHLQAAQEILNENIPVTAYHWQHLLDRKTKIGLIAVDEYENRTFKDSAYWLKAVIETRNPAWEPGVDYKGMD